MELKLCSGLVVLFIAVFSASVAHADEPGTVGVEETVSETGEPADPVTARLESEVLRYYRGVGAEPTEAELKSGLSAASDMVLADVAIDQISLAIDEAIKRHNSGADVPFAVAIPGLVRALADEETPAGEDEPPEAVEQPAWRVAADRNIEGLSVAEAGLTHSSSPRLKRRGSPRLKRRGTALMVSSFVVQGLSFGTLVGSLFEGHLTYVSWAVHLVSIPFAPLVVTGFADRFGGSSPTGRLHWTGMGLLYAAAYSGLVGGVGVLSSFWEPLWSDRWAPFAPRQTGLILSHFAPGIAHLAVGIGLVTAGALCVGRARAQAPWQGEYLSRRPAARAAHRGFVVPTMAPRADGLTLGVAGVF